MKTFVTFLGKMHSGSDEVSSKRVYASMLVLLVISMVIGAQFFHKALDFSVFLTLLITISTFCGMNLAADLKAMGIKKDIASDIVTNTQDNESAKDVLKADEPK